MGRGDFSALDTFSCRHFGEVPLNNVFLMAKMWRLAPHYLFSL
jgi:hypothetical protein